MRNTLFYTLCFGFILGVLWRSFFHTDIRIVFFAGIISIVLIGGLLLFPSSKSSRAWSMIGTVCILAAVFGILRMHIADTSPWGAAPQVFADMVGQKVLLTGMIVDKPVEKDTDVALTVRVQNGNAQTEVLATVKNDAVYRYGDTITLAGTLQIPKDFETDQGKIFDYAYYLKKDGIYFIIRHPQVQIIARGGGTMIHRVLFSLSDRMSAALDTAIGGTEALVERALVLGERASFDPTLRQDFINTGLIHVVTISGYHVTLVAEWILIALSALPMTAAAGVGMSAVFLYVIMTGGAQTAIRAGIMAALALLAKSTGRSYDAGRALLLAGVGMVVFNPLILAFDVSFELSFLATIAVIFLAPKMEAHLRWIVWRWLREIISITLAAYLFVLPFILYKMGTWSLVALPANIAVLPFIPATMIAGFLTSFLGLFSHTLALIPGTIAYGLLHYELAAIRFFSHLPFSAVTIRDFPLVLMIAIYALLAYALFAQSFSARFSHMRRGAFIAAILLTIVTGGAFAWSHVQSNHVAADKMATLLIANATHEAVKPAAPFVPDMNTKTTACALRGALPDHACTPGAIFPDATIEQICVRGYTQQVRSVSRNIRKAIFAEYSIAYPQPRGAYEVDHLIPLALGGSNDRANLFPEAAAPMPGFHEKDLVEIYLQGEVCDGHVTLPVAQRQIADDWLAVYQNLTPEQIAALKKKYGTH